MTTATAQIADAPIDPISDLKRLPGLQGDTQCLLAGENSAVTSLLVPWFPVLAALCYGLVMPWLGSPWDQNNLALVLVIWLVVWLGGAAFTLTNGSGRHLYVLDLDQRRITHLNTGESTSLALELHRKSEGDLLELKTPLQSGWHLQTYVRAVAELEQGEIRNIPEWQPSSLKSHIEQKARDGSLVVLLIFATIFLGVSNFVMGTFGLFLLSELYLLLAWLVTQTTTWLLERRDCQPHP